MHQREHFVTPMPSSSSSGRKRAYSFTGAPEGAKNKFVDANAKPSGHKSSGSVSHLSPPIRPQTPAAASSRYTDSRPPMPQRATWSNPSHPMPFAPKLKIHRTLSCTPAQPALVYDVIQKPNHLNILSAQTMGAISPHTLNLPATLPHVTELTLVCRDLLWPITVTSTTDRSHAITSLDVIEAVHFALHIPITRAEWELLGQNPKVQARVADAFAKRSARSRDRENGVRRCDWLQGRTILLGIESRSNGSYELVFGK